MRRNHGGWVVLGVLASVLLAAPYALDGDGMAVAFAAMPPALFAILLMLRPAPV